MYWAYKLLVDLPVDQNRRTCCCYYSEWTLIRFYIYWDSLWDRHCSTVQIACGKLSFTVNCSLITIRAGFYKAYCSNSISDSRCGQPFLLSTMMVTSTVRKQQPQTRVMIRVILVVGSSNLELSYRDWFKRTLIYNNPSYDVTSLMYHLNGWRVTANITSQSEANWICLFLKSICTFNLPNTQFVVIQTRMLTSTVRPKLTLSPWLLPITL